MSLGHCALGPQFFRATPPALSSGLLSLQHVAALSACSDQSLTWPSWWKGWPGVLHCPLKFRNGGFLPFVAYTFLEATASLDGGKKLPSDSAAIYKYYRYVKIIFIWETPRHLEGSLSLTCLHICKSLVTSQWWRHLAEIQTKWGWNGIRHCSSSWQSHFLYEFWHLYQYINITFLYLYFDIYL